MAWRRRLIVSVVLILPLAGCGEDMRARRFPPVTAPKNLPNITFPKETKPEPLPANYGWLEPRQRLDVPIEFVAEQSADWPQLKEYWNEFPGPVGLGLWPLAQPVLEAVAALESQVHSEKIKLKVPRGLPDPTPYVPAANPPTYGKWILGRRIFFDRTLLSVAPGQGTYCADCHNPGQAFSSSMKTAASGNRNVPSLINSVYNRNQFWDGRAGSLEEVLLRRLEDERPLTQEPPREQSPGYLHVWPGLVGHLRGRPDYLHAFQQVFGTAPTADNRFCGATLPGNCRPLEGSITGTSLPLTSKLCEKSPARSSAVGTRRVFVP